MNRENTKIGTGKKYFQKTFNFYQLLRGKIKP
jgi:hypothetical protein